MPTLFAYYTMHSHVLWIVPYFANIWVLPTFRMNSLQIIVKLGQYYVFLSTKKTNNVEQIQFKTLNSEYMLWFTFYFCILIAFYWSLHLNETSVYYKKWLRYLNCASLIKLSHCFKKQNKTKTRVKKWSALVIWTKCSTHH